LEEAIESAGLKSMSEAESKLNVSASYYGKYAYSSGKSIQGTTCIGDTIIQFYHDSYYAMFNFSDLSLIRFDKAAVLGTESPHCWIVNHYFTDAHDTIVMYAGFSSDRTYYLYKKHNTDLNLLKTFWFIPDYGGTPNYFVDYPNRKLYIMGGAAIGNTPLTVIHVYSFEGDQLDEIGDLEERYVMPSFIHTLQDVLIYDHYLYVSYGDGNSYLGYVRIDLRNWTYHNVSLKNDIPSEEPEGFFEHEGVFYLVTAPGKVYKIEENEIMPE